MTQGPQKKAAVGMSCKATDSVRRYISHIDHSGQVRQFAIKSRAPKRFLDSPLIGDGWQHGALAACASIDAHIFQICAVTGVHELDPVAALNGGSVSVLPDPPSHSM